MNGYNPYPINQQFANFNSIQPQQFSPYQQTLSEEVSSSVNSSIEPSYPYETEYRQRRVLFDFFRGRQYFSRRIPVNEVNPFSAVLASICEVKNIGGAVKPYPGPASIEIFNVTPEQGFVTVTGRIWWDNDLDCRITLVVY